jgi:GRAM domain-containing protein 4
MLSFTPFMTSSPISTRVLSRLQGVKKTNWTKGLLFTWLTDDADKEQEEEVFRLIENRDELFARLIGLEGKRWVKT